MSYAIIIDDGSHYGDGYFRIERKSSVVSHAICNPKPFGRRDLVRALIYSRSMSFSRLETDTETFYSDLSPRVLSERAEAVFDWFDSDTGMASDYLKEVIQELSEHLRDDEKDPDVVHPFAWAWLIEEVRSEVAEEVRAIDILDPPNKKPHRYGDRKIDLVRITEKKRDRYMKAMYDHCKNLLKSEKLLTC